MRKTCSFFFSFSFLSVPSDWQASLAIDSPMSVRFGCDVCFSNQDEGSTTHREPLLLPCLLAMLRASGAQAVIMKTYRLRHVVKK